MIFIVYPDYRISQLVVGHGVVDTRTYTRLNERRDLHKHFLPPLLPSTIHTARAL